MMPIKPSQPTARLQLLDDDTLARLAQVGSTPAFAVLVNRYQASVRMFLRRIAPAPSMADDLSQDSFLKAWRMIKQWQGHGSLKGWLFMIANNAAQDARRSFARSMARDKAWLDESLGKPDPSTALEASLDLERVLAALSVPQRDVVALCYGAGLTHQEASQALSLPLGTVKSHAARGREIALSILRQGEQNAAQARIGQ